MQIKKVTLTKEDLGEMVGLIKKKLTCFYVNKKYEIECNFNGYTIYVSFDTDISGDETISVREKELKFHANIDNFQPVDSDGIECELGFSDEDYNQFLEYIEFKINS